MPGCAGQPQSGWVALRKESVDRNAVRPYDAPLKRLSLSARRAWIEIVTRYRPTPKPVVALRKESVDRNIASRQLPAPKPPSLSARRAWIEI